jgi:hypothetical protein
MKIQELLSEGMYVVKSKDGVEKRFKKSDSPEAKDWAASTQKKATLAKYSQAWWKDKEDKAKWKWNDADAVYPWTEIDDDELNSSMVSKATFSGDQKINDYHIQKEYSTTVDGVKCATVDVFAQVVHNVHDLGYDDETIKGMDLDNEDGDVMDGETVTFHRDPKNPKKLVSA